MQCRVNIKLLNRT